MSFYTDYNDASLRIKNGVDLSMIDPRMWSCVGIVKKIYEKYGYDTVITSGREGKHSCRSRHYYGAALDFRTRHINDGAVKKYIARDIYSELKNTCSVMLEDTHLHVAFDSGKGEE